MSDDHTYTRALQVRDRMVASLQAQLAEQDAQLAALRQHDDTRDPEDTATIEDWGHSG